MALGKLPDPYEYDKDQYMYIDSRTFEETIYYKHDCAGTKFWSTNLIEDYEEVDNKNKVKSS